MEWADGKQRCWWANPNNEAYVRYHDEEWGVPVRDDRMLFEMLILEGFQAGLSWECVLNKRAAFRRAFDNFDAQAVSAYGPEKLAALQSDAGIIRNRLKIRAAVGNARAFLAIQQEFAPFRRCIEGFEKARHEVCGHHHHLCLSAGRGRHLLARKGLLSGARGGPWRLTVWA